MEDNPRENELVEDPDSSLFVAPVSAKKKGGRRHKKTRRASRKRARRSTRKRI